MSDRPQDADLRARFDAQRRADAEETPSFAAVMARARSDGADAAAAKGGDFRLPRLVPSLRERRRFAVAGGLIAAAAVAAILLVPRSHASEDAFEQAVLTFRNDPALGAWRSPTEGLLNVPGRQLISTVPSVGRQP